MASTSSIELANELLSYCLRGDSWPDSLLVELVARATGVDEAVAAAASQAFFGVLVERLADLFEPRLCDVYAALFSEVIPRVLPEFSTTALLDRYRTVREVRPYRGAEPGVVYVLSRVTLGADVAVTSVVLDAVKRRYPAASIRFAGARKNWELFARDERVEWHPIEYGRGGALRERLASAPRFEGGDVLVIDPDSRFTQLGLLPVCDDSRYLFFESRSYGGDSARSLPDLTAEWLERTLGVPGARPYIAPAAEGPDAEITVSLGVGNNDEKRISDSFERALIAELADSGRSILLDTGAGGEERRRAEALAAAHHGVQLWRGNYAPFANAIARSRLYVGYDSAGQHVAAACGTPLVSVFAGYASERMLARWCPSGSGPLRVIQVADRRDPGLLDAVRSAIRELLQ